VAYFFFNFCSPFSASSFFFLVPPYTVLPTLTTNPPNPTNHINQQMAQQAEAAAAKAKLEAQVNAAALPVMELPAPQLPQPAALVGTMRPYQLQGLSWLVI